MSNQMLHTVARSLNSNDSRVVAMVADIRAQFDKRDIQEATKPALSYNTERARMLANVDSVARLFVALDMSDASFINRTLHSGTQFNAKAFKKVTEIALSVCGINSKIERVTRAFFACTILLAKAGKVELVNKTNQAFVDGARFEDELLDSELVAAINANRREHCGNSSATQSSQMRQIFEALNVAQIMPGRHGLIVNRSSKLYQYFNLTLFKKDKQDK